MIEVLKEVDLSILKFIHTVTANEWFDALCPILRTKTTWIPLYFIFIYSLWKKFSTDVWKIVLMGIVLVIFSDLLCAQLLKPFFHRLRPCQIKEFSSWLRTFSHCSQTFSFPSCHAINHATLASFIFIYFPKRYSWLLIIWVLSIAFSQVYIGVHFPLDVFGGMVIGSLIGWAGSKWIRNLMKNQSDQ